MKIFTSGDWSRLETEYPPHLVEMLKVICASGESSVLSLQEVASQAGVDPNVVDQVLGILVDNGFFVKGERDICPNCRREVSAESLAQKSCSNCSFSFEKDSPRRESIFTRSGQRARDVRWVVSVHGMNTRGAWQEEFAWKLSVAYGYSIPVFIYKYGKLFVSPLLLIRQSIYRDRLIAALSERCREMALTAYGPRPDIIAHSFGTWLVAEALSKDPELRVGRIVLAGSIVRPDFDWRPLVEGGRVEAVLCHRGGRDLWVRLAQYFIPNSGPSGFSGFNDREIVVDKLEPLFSHSDFFSKRHLDSVLKTTWAPFLTSSVPAAAAIESGGTGVWRPARWRVLTHVLKYCVLAVIGVLLGVAAYVFGVGVYRLADRW